MGVFHRDIKPENVLLTRQGDAKLADFGLGALADGDALLDTACGTLHYAAPEVARRGRYAGGPADIWSLGVVLYAMLAGRLPFEEEHNAALVARIAAAAYEPLPAQVSAEAAQVVGAMLQVEPAARPSAETIWDMPWVKGGQRAAGQESAGASPSSPGAVPLAAATGGLHSAVSGAERLGAQIESVVSPRSAVPSKAPSAFALLRSSFDISGMFDPDRAAPVLRRTRFTAASDLLPHIRREVQSAGGRAVETAGNVGAADGYVGVWSGGLARPACGLDARGSASVYHCFLIRHARYAQPRHAISCLQCDHVCAGAFRSIAGAGRALRSGASKVPDRYLPHFRVVPGFLPLVQRVSRDVWRVLRPVLDKWYQ